MRHRARQVADQLSAAVIIPMHYRFGDYGIPVIGEVEDFLSLAGELSCPSLSRKPFHIGI